MPVTLTNPGQIAAPKWLTDQSALKPLQDTYGQLSSLYDTTPLKQASDRFNESFANRAEMGFDAQSRAAINHAMLSGGKVGANFSKGALMLGLQNNLNANNLDYSKIAAQMMAQRAAQQGSLANQIANYGQNAQQMRLGYTQGQQGMGLQAQIANQNAAMDAARLAQQGNQFGQTMGLNRDQFDFQRLQYNNQLALQQAQMQQRNRGSGAFSYSVDNLGMPLTTGDAARMGMAQDYMRGSGGGAPQLQMAFGGGGGYTRSRGGGSQTQAAPKMPQPSQNDIAAKYWMDHQAALRNSQPYYADTDNRDGFLSGAFQNA